MRGAGLGMCCASPGIEPDAGDRGVVPAATVADAIGYAASAVPVLRISRSKIFL